MTRWISGHGWHYRLSPTGRGIQRSKTGGPPWEAIGGTISSRTAEAGIRQLAEAAEDLCRELRGCVGIGTDGEPRFTRPQTWGAYDRLHRVLKGGEE